MKNLYLFLLLLSGLSFGQNCGEVFTDSGINSNYGNNTDQIFTICPSEIGQMVTVSFTMFQVEIGYDALYVYDGNSTSAPQIMSNNGGGNVPGGLPGGFWGSAIPSSFTASNPDGCLTFRFISDSGVTDLGWSANVSCEPLPPINCERPDSLTASNISQTSALLGWTEPNQTVTQWEVLVLPYGAIAPSAAIHGTPTSDNAYLIATLVPATYYAFYVRGVCSDSGYSQWTLARVFATLPTNDECDTATVLPVNSGSQCLVTTTSNLNGATMSNEAIGSCAGTPDDDIWFQFTATNPIHRISLQNLPGNSTNNINYAVYSGTCESLTPFVCGNDPANAAWGNFVVGATYFIRVFSTLAETQIVNFKICINTPSVCETAQAICPDQSYPNTTGTPNTGSAGCLFVTPNPAFFSLKVGAPGTIKLHIAQSTNGSIPDLESDFVYWGPFASTDEACTAIANNAAPNTGDGCGYSIASTDIVTIPNAETGDYYIFMVTNFANQNGTIKFTVDPTSTGSVDCPGIHMNAFLDSNTNGIKDSGEPDFPLGQFSYQINGDGEIHYASSSSGAYTIYESDSSNIYDLGYLVNSEFSTLYNCTTVYTGIGVSTGVADYFFPVTIEQDATDISVSLVPLSPVRAGLTYINKLVYTNTGNQTVSGVVTFGQDNVVSIASVSEPGIVANSNGFTLAFTDLAPYGSRTIFVTMNVPPIPQVTIGQMVTTSASITPADDELPANNMAVLSQPVMAAWDPNDKTEAHGPRILADAFTPQDYLYYTIRFENTGNLAAIDVSIIDLLDAQLDETSVETTAASHGYTLERTANQLTWVFRDINLPVSVENADIGKGFVSFRVKPKPGFSVGDAIPNTASILFDANPAIVTNTFETEFVNALGNATIMNGKVSIYPNPTHSSINVKMTQTAETIALITVYDIVGKSVKTMQGISSHDANVDVSDLSAGIYLIEIQTGSGNKLLKKLVKQ